MGFHTHSATHRSDERTSYADFADVLAHVYQYEALTRMRTQRHSVWAVDPLDHVPNQPRTLLAEASRM
jgi:hypothetical protein